VEYTARQAVETTHVLLQIAAEDRQRIQRLKRTSGTVLQVHQALLQRPLNTIPNLCKATGLSPATVASALKTLQKLEITRELTGKQRYRHFAYSRYIDRLSEGLEKP
jgi:Fic family protein